ncbi:Ribonuclease [Trichinella pseudospiralis]|uniref:Ribonuclease n=1 Tax=Trichinella pseudospiralis TaxID=6337 RepID=A0A0V1FMV6_TRIPS|nr:Ribonuclease [Trichinella pseudospiralis]
MQVDNYGEPMKFIHYVSLGERANRIFDEIYSYINIYLPILYAIAARFACREKKINFKMLELCFGIFISLQYWKRQISRFTMRTIIQTSAAPKAIGPYSQAVLVDRTLYISGQLGLCPSSMELIDGGADKQCRQALLNMGEILKAAGATYDDDDIENYIVKTTIFLSDMRNWNTINDVYKECKFFFQRKLSCPICFSSSCTTEGNAICGKMIVALFKFKYIDNFCLFQNAYVEIEAVAVVGSNK